MDYPLPQPPTFSWLRLLPALLGRFTLICLLGALALLPFDLTFFVPSAPSFFNTLSAWPGPNRLIFTSLYQVSADALCLLLVLAAIGLDRHLRGQTSAVRAVLLALAPLLLLVIVVYSHNPVQVWLFAPFSRGMGGIGIPLDLLPFFFVACAAAFLVSGLVQQRALWQQLGFFVLVGLLCAGAGLLLHLLALLLRSNQQDGTDILIYDLWQLLPLVLALGGLGGLAGGALRLGMRRYFSAPAEAERVIRELAPVAVVARLWAVAWRLILAGAIGALPLMEDFFSLSLALNRRTTPLIQHTPFGLVWLTSLLPWLLVGAGLLIGQEAQQHGRALARVGAGLLFSLLTLGSIDAVIMLYGFENLRHPELFPQDFLTRIAISYLLVLLPRALFMTLAVGSGPFSGRVPRLAGLALLGMAVFLGSLPPTLHDLSTFLAAPELHGSPDIPASFLVPYIAAGLVGAGLCGLLGGWLRSRALALAVHLSHQQTTPAANMV
jgi:hypothetical protein